MSRQESGRSYRHHQPNKSSRRKWLYLNIGVAISLIAVGIGSLLLMGQQSATGASQQTDTLVQASRGTAAPDFALFSPEGQEISLSDYEGQVILINWWATWCPPCKAEMPAINAFYESYQADGFVVLAVNSQEGASTVKDFIQENGFTFPVLLDSQGQVMDRYHVRALPTSFIIDRHGVIQHIQTGEITSQQLEAIVEPLL
jgi:peroxiredoxin